ncbi:MAG: hypothetical protein QXS91_03255, partial [Candidatus Anstonellales archaeon]
MANGVQKSKEQKQEKTKYDLKDKKDRERFANEVLLSQHTITQLKMTGVNIDAYKKAVEEFKKTGKLVLYFLHREGDEKEVGRKINMVKEILENKFKQHGLAISSLIIEYSKGGNTIAARIDGQKEKRPADVLKIMSPELLAEDMVDEKIIVFLGSIGYENEEQFYNKFDHLKAEMGNKKYREVKNQVRNFLRIMTLTQALYNGIISKTISEERRYLTTEEKIEAAIISMTLSVWMLGYKPKATADLVSAMNERVLDCDSSSFLLGSFLSIALRNEKEKVSISYMNAFLLKEDKKKEDSFVGHTNLIIGIGEGEKARKYLIEATNMISSDKPFSFLTQINSYYLPRGGDYTKGDEYELFKNISALGIKEDVMKNIASEAEILQHVIARFIAAGLTNPWNPDPIRYYYA